MWGGLVIQKNILVGHFSGYYLLAKSAPAKQ